jgi:hypothetical protein
MKKINIIKFLLICLMPGYNQRLSTAYYSSEAVLDLLSAIDLSDGNFSFADGFLC